LKHSTVIASLALSAVLPLCSCDAHRESSPPNPGATQSASPGASQEPGKAAALLKGSGSAYETAEVTNAGALEVDVKFSGDPVPEPTEVPVDTNVETCGHKVFTESLLVDKASRGLKNVVVRLEGIARGKAPPAIVTVNNKSCAFDPHVAVAVKGTKLEIRSADPILHTTHPYLAGASWFNLPLQKEEQPPARPIPRTGLMELTCDVHKWMRGYIVVHTNPYLAVSDATGKLKIEGIPAGRYPYVAWHEQLGEKKGEVEVIAGKAAELKLEFAAPK